MTQQLRINGVARPVDVDADTPVLWVLRDVLGMTGTKFGCGIGLCGACTRVALPAAAEVSSSKAATCCGRATALQLEIPELDGVKSGCLKFPHGAESGVWRCPAFLRTCVLGNLWKIPDPWSLKDLPLIVLVQRIAR